MNGFGYGILEYLAWVAVAVLLLIVVFVCLAICLAISSAVNPLAAKWKLVSNVKHPQTPEPAPIRHAMRFYTDRTLKLLHRRKARRKLQPPGSSADSK